jgi:putative DNA primase/helicase
MCGYCLTGDVSEDAFFLLHGIGSNGKTTFLEILRALLGYEFAKSTPPATFLKKRESSSGPSPEFARLRACRVVTAVETERGQRLATGIVKAATGGDRQAARHLYAELIEFHGQYKPILAVNNRPDVPDQSKGMWRRIHLVPFEAVFEQNTAGFDKHLDKRLLKELSGILNWAIRGALLWQERGLDPPEKVVAATQAYMREQSRLTDFFDERCEFERRAWIRSDVLLKTYREWCAEAGEEPLVAKDFGTELRERGVTARRDRIDGKQRRGWRGVRLREPPETAETAESGSFPSQTTHETAAEIGFGSADFPKQASHLSQVSQEPLDTFNAYTTANEILRVQMPWRTGTTLGGAISPNAQ